MALLSRKAQASIVAALLFFVVSSPLTYRLVDSLVGGVVTALVPAFAPLFKVAQAGCPTNYGLVLHAVVFGVITYLLMLSN
jgi:hypothetical protein